MAVEDVHLTPRQREIGRMLDERALDYPEIADELGISVRTVQEHVYAATAWIPGEDPPKRRLRDFMRRLRRMSGP